MAALPEASTAQIHHRAIRPLMPGTGTATTMDRKAIASRVPYGEWSQKMVEDFGLSDVITIHFNYL